MHCGHAQTPAGHRAVDNTVSSHKERETGFIQVSEHLEHGLLWCGLGLPNWETGEQRQAGLKEGKGAGTDRRQGRVLKRNFLIVSPLVDSMPEK